MRLMVTAMLLAVVTSAGLRAACGCDPLGVLTNGRQDTVASVDALRSSIAGGTVPAEIYLRAGEYRLTTPLLIDRPGITIRSLSGRREDVVIKGPTGEPFEGIVVTQGNFAIADLTLAEMIGATLTIAPSSLTGNFIVHNVGFLDSRRQFMRVTGPASNCLIECSTFFDRFMITLPSVTPGIEIDGASNCMIRNCEFRDIRRAEPRNASAVLAHGAARNILVDKCRFIDCDMAMVIGDSTDFSVAVQGGMIRTNTIKGHTRSGPAITILGAQGISIENNTIFQMGVASPRSIDIRFPQSLGIALLDNLMSGTIEQRDGVIGTLSQGNITNVGAAGFRNPFEGDLHLVAGSPAINAGSETQDDDIDCEPIIDGRPDAGADEYRPVSGVDDGRGDPMGSLAYDPAGRAIVVAGTGSLELRMVDIAGRTVLAGRARGMTRLPAPGLAAGVYLLIARDDRGEMRSRKIVVPR